MEQKSQELARWTPFREVSRLRDEMDRLWEDFFGSEPRARFPMTGEWLPAVDISDTADTVTVKVEIPGMEAKDVDVSLSGNVLTIKGEKKIDKEAKEENYYMAERSYGSFVRSLKLPAAVQEDKIEARYDQGVLTVTCPKKEEIKPKQVTVKSE
ncbi:MAG: Hsp20/alpha crystallin family protein [Thermodesulfobacteriota bacterium]